MTIVQTKTCAHCGVSFDITQSDMDFYAKISPKFGDYVADIPTPTLCPDCRLRRRLAFRNERKLYHAECDASKKPIISIYSPDKPHKVYDQKIRWSDTRDALEYGRDFDFSRTFTEQFGEMMRDVPLPNLYNTLDLLENSEYVNYTSPAKNAYMVIEGTDVEDCYYSRSIVEGNDVVDCLFVYNSQQCYESVNLYNCSNVFYSQFCENCSYSYFLKDCKNCNNCIMCIGLSGKSYCINNVQYTEEEYFQYLKGGKVFTGKIPSGAFETNINVRDCSGEYISNSSNVFEGFDVDNSEDAKFLKMTINCKNSYDISSWGDGCNLCYEYENGGRSVYKSAFCYTSYDNISYGYYLYNVVASQNCFGCIGLRNKEYCIFNKQYTKESYELLVPRIIEHMKKTGEWGEFFHPSLSPFGYNETVANEYFPVQPPSVPPSGGSSDTTVPLSGGEGLGVRKLQRLGYKRSDYEAPQPQVDKVIPGEKLPAQGCAIIQEKKPAFLQDILKYAIRCEKSQKLFRLIPQEIAFYTKHNLPLPRRHPDVRHAERMEMRR